MKTHADSFTQTSARSPHMTRLTLRTDGKVLVLKASEIDTIEAAGNYVAVQAGNESYILRQTLNALERLLDGTKFLRVSRSAIVNLERVKELRPMFKGEYVMILLSGRRLAMTRRLREVEEALRFS